MGVCKNVYISNCTGTNQDGCGNLPSLPCKTINYALNNTVIDNDTILLMSSFDISEPLQIQKKGLTFKSDNTSSVITCHKSSLIKIPTIGINLTFEEINFVEVSLFDSETSNTNIYVKFDGCFIYQGTKTFMMITNNDNEVNIHVNNCTFNPLNSNIPLKPSVLNSDWSFFDIHMAQDFKAKIFFSSIKVAGKMTLKTFFKCYKCLLNWKSVSFEDCTLQTALNLSLTDGIIDSLSVKSCTSSGKEKDFYFISFDTARNLKFTGQALFYDNNFNKRLMYVCWYSSIIFESLEIENSMCKNRFITTQSNGKVKINNFVLKNSSSLAIEAIRLTSSSSLIIDKATIFNNRLFQFILMQHDNLKSTRSTGNFTLRQSTISFNRYTQKKRSTFFGIVYASSFEISNMNFSWNSGMTNIFDIQRTNAIIRNVNITDSIFGSGIKGILSNMRVENIILRGNNASGFGKALIYEGDICEQFNITIRNLHASINDHPRFQDRADIFSINIRNSSLIMDNVVIDIQPMQHEIIAVVSLKFETLNQNALRNETIQSGFAYKFSCPPGYNPELKQIIQSNLYSESYTCIPCSRGLYSLERGSASLLYINNTDIDIINWKHTDIAYRPESIWCNCKTCPQGGNCTYGIRSRGNYFGETTDDNKSIHFLPCPPFYCCSNEPKARICEHYNTCNYHRSGSFCGRCDHGYFESFIIPKCFLNSECTNELKYQFWGFYSLFAFLFTLAILYLRDVWCLIKRFLSVVKSKLHKNETDKYEEDKNLEDPSAYIFSQVIHITVSFFQMMSIVEISVKPTDTLFKFMRALNLQVVFFEIEKICPFKDMNAVWKNIIDTVLFVGIMLFCLFMIGIIFFIISKIIKLCRSKDTNGYESIDGEANESTHLCFNDKLMLGCIKILIFGFKNIFVFTITSLFCTKINGTLVLYLSGNIECYQTWQYIAVALLLLWVIPFPAALVTSYKMFDKRTINKPIFLLCLFFPWVTLAYMIKNSKSKSCYLEERVGLNSYLYDLFEAPFRSTSAREDGSVKTMYWWAAWRLYERLIIAVLVNVLIDPLFRMCVLAPVMVILLMLHYHLKPYKEHLTLLSWLDISSYAFLLFYVVDNLFRSFTYIYDIPIQNQIADNMELLQIFKLGLTPLTVILGFLVSSVVIWMHDKLTARN